MPLLPWENRVCRLGCQALITSLALFVLPPMLGADEAGTIGKWIFDGNAADCSGADRKWSKGAPSFAEGRKGQALDCNWNALELDDAPELQLTPGFSIDCWVCWERLEGKEQVIVKKDQEYLLRVSGHEDMKFCFFVFLNGGWEPRVQGPVPKTGTWYHVVARWNGSETVLAVNGEKSSVIRTGAAVATRNPVTVGNMGGRIEQLTFQNPNLARGRELAECCANTRTASVSQTRFGGSDGWPGWQALGGAQLKIDKGLMAGRLPTRSACYVQPALDIELGKSKYLCLDLGVAVRDLTIRFITERGSGSINAAAGGTERTTFVDMSAAPGWSGRLKALAIALPDGVTGDLALQRISISEKPEGRPYFYARSFTTVQALPRAGREESVQAVVHNVGAEGASVKARLLVPAGVTILDGDERTLPVMPMDGIEAFTWKIKVDQAGDPKLKLELSALGIAPTQKSIVLHVTSNLNLPKATYVPVPQPAATATLNLMHYCALWKEGSHYGWGKVEPYPERRPVIGFYDEGTPEVADWHIKMALEHGIQGFIYCWYRNGYTPEIKQTLGHAIHDGLMKARYRDRFKFAIMWENGCADGVKGQADLMDNLFPFWMANYFKHPSYVKIDNKPLLVIWVPANVRRDLGKPEKVHAAFDAMRAACRQEGFDGLWIVACSYDTDPAARQLMVDEGWDATTAYNTFGEAKKPPLRDPEGLSMFDQAEFMANQEKVWRAKKEGGGLPDIINPTAGWDNRPWAGKTTAGYYGPQSSTNFLACVRAAKALVDQTTGNGLDKRVVIFDNWNEFGEGHYIEPTAGSGFSFLDAIKAVFAPASTPCMDITPLDVGLPFPEKVYLKRREIFGSSLGGPLKIKDNLLAWWRFDEDSSEFALDSSGNHLTATKQDYETTPGKAGKAMLCKGATISLGARPEFFPEEGLTIEAWIRVDEPKQGDRWILNTISGNGTAGYRLGLGDGKLAWQVPKGAWSHMLGASKPLPLGVWVHVAASYDGEYLHLFQDGQAMGKLQRGGPIAPADGKVVVGNFLPGLGNNFFQGAIDELRIFNRALSAEEVVVHMKEGK